MSVFGKLNFSTSFNPTSAFPLDARCYFTDLESAEAAAAKAEEVGSTNTVYHYGMRVLVDDGSTTKWYTIQRDNTLLADISENYVNSLVMLTAEEIEKLNELLMAGAPVCKPTIEITYYRHYSINGLQCCRIDATITNVSKGLIQKFEVGRVLEYDKYTPPIEWYEVDLTLGDTEHTMSKTFETGDDKMWAKWGLYLRLTYYNLLGDTETVMAKTVDAPGVIT